MHLPGGGIRNSRKPRNATLELAARRGLVRPRMCIITVVLAKDCYRNDRNVKLTG